MLTKSFPGSWSPGESEMFVPARKQAGPSLKHYLSHTKGSRKKVISFSGPATKALRPNPIELSGHRPFFFGGGGQK